MNYTYLIVNVAAILVPFIFSFHPKLKFNKEWKAALLAITMVGFLFIIWDIYYTKIGVWGFNPKHLIGLNIINLPIEEILFFICIPYSCLFTYHCLKILIPRFSFLNTRAITVVLSLFFLIIGVIYYPNLYTSLTFIALSIILLIISIINKMPWLPRLYTSLVLLIFPFLLVNGILTGLWINEEVVWYSSNEIIGFRILTIPIEDFFYGFFLIIMNVWTYEFIKLKIGVNDPKPLISS